jgi:hypothetical protein
MEERFFESVEHFKYFERTLKINILLREKLRAD